MSKIYLQSVFQPDVTQLSNLFIDRFMPQANGDFVKVYIYLLRCLSDSSIELNTARIADRLLCTEGDVLRALKYWEQKKILLLHFDTEGQLSSIELCDPRSHLSDMKETGPAPDPAGSVQTSVSASSVPAAPVKTLTADRVKELKSNEDIMSLLYVAEQYMARPLTASETQKLLFFYDDLHMSVDLIDYLIEYCVSHGHSSIHYMDTVAQAWTKEGITSVEKARQASSRYRKDYFTILRAMGITGRNPVTAEAEMMGSWLDEYGMSMDLILEACRRTVIQTGQASFPYADKILSEWYSSHVSALSDVVALDQAHARRKSVKTEKSPLRSTKTRAANRFNNFQQRDYNFEEYEKMLLARTNTGS